MGLKGYRLCVMGQLDSNVQSSTVASRLARLLMVLARSSSRFAAVQVAHVKANFETRLSLQSTL
jgi:hypothetical protein